MEKYVDYDKLKPGGNPNIRLILTAVSLLSNTPLREVLEASPINDKIIFLVENYPKKVNKLPRNLPEVYHRARDIIFSDRLSIT